MLPSSYIANVMGNVVIHGMPYGMSLCLEIKRAYKNSLAISITSEIFHYDSSTNVTKAANGTALAPQPWRPSWSSSIRSWRCGVDELLF